MTDDHDAAVAAAAAAIGERLREPPEVLLTLGSGLARVADAVEEPIDIAAADVPGLPATTVAGHAGALRAGRLGGRPVLVQVGRSHLYEGHPPAVVTRVVEAAAALGASTYVVTNAAGGLRPDHAPGQLLCITDHLNLTGTSPLVGVVRDDGPVFVDMGHAYDRELVAVAREEADRRGYDLALGVYAGLLGPAYETPAEVRMLRTLGADAVGMSTVLEVIAARAWGLRVLGLSALTNVHGRGPVSHEEVLEVGRDAGGRLAELLLAVIPRL